MSKRRRMPERRRKPKTSKIDHRLHPIKTTRGRPYRFTDKHHAHPKGDHACWLPSISRDVEFSLFQGAEAGDFGDERGNLYNVHRDNEEYLEIGTRHELIAIFWNPHSVAEWHGHPLWPIKVRGAMNRKNQAYAPPRMPLQRMADSNRISRRDADRLLRGDYP